MGHSYIRNPVHAVFSTKQRRPFAVELKRHLWAYLGGIARENGIKSMAIGGTTDHVHLLLLIPATMPVAKAIQLIKGGSSKWVRDTFASARSFEWQEGYAAFGVSASQESKVIQYIRHQEEHHRKVSFDEEFVSLLKKHGIEFDPRYVLG